MSIPLIAILVLFAYRAPSLAGSGITDPDYYWHVGYGEWILEHGALPTVDFWSWSFDGRSYRLTQWLGEVVMGFANQQAGLLGTSILAAGLVALTMAASYRAARIYLDNRLAALAVVFVCNSVFISLACRPHQFTHLGLAVLTWIMASFQNGNRQALYWLPPLFALWVNLHGGYAFGLTFLAVVWVCLAVEAVVIRDLSRIKGTLVPLAAAITVSFLATLLNPYGPGAWQYAIEIANLKSSSAGVVDEWSATSIKTEVGLSFFIVVSSVFAAMALTSRRLPVNQVLTSLALLAIGWSAVRLSLMATVLMVPLLAAALRGTALYELAFAGEARRYDRKIHTAVGIALIFIVGAASYGLSVIEKTTHRYMASKLPVEEVAFMKAHGISGKLLNTAEAGGYIIRHMEGAKVSIDTRLDLYGDRALFELLFALRGDAGWQDYLSRMDADVLVLNNPMPLRHLAADSGEYRPVFEGPAYTVLVRKGQRPDLPTVELKAANREILDALTS